MQVREDLKLAGEIKTSSLNENLTPDLKRSLETLGTNEAREITKHGGGGVCTGRRQIETRSLRNHRKKELIHEIVAARCPMYGRR